MTWAVATETIDRVGVLGTPVEAPEEPYAIIPLHGKYGTGKVAKVSLQDAKRVRRYRWYACDKGYARAYQTLRSGSYKLILMHRLILDAPDGVLVDHERGDTLDNRRSRIRLATHVDNARNRRRRRNKRVSQYIGVSRQQHDNKWKAFICVDSYRVCLGGYKTEEEAARVYDACARYHFKEFAVCNFEGTEALSYEETRARAQAGQRAQFSSSFTGVHWAANEGKWKARFTFEGTRYALGVYQAEVEAAQAHDACVRYFLGDKARTNFPEGETLSPHELRRRNLAAAFERDEVSSRYVHVYAKDDKWTADIKVGKERHFIGYFGTELEAAQAHDACVRYHLLPGAFTNFEGTEAVSIAEFRSRKTARSSSGFWGVVWHKQERKWRAQISINGVKRQIGSYADKHEAARAYDAVARFHHGSKATTNFEGTEALSLEQIRPKPGPHLYHPNSRSKYAGVNWNKKSKRWYAVFWNGTKDRKHIGSFHDEEDAARAVDAFRLTRGFPKINFPDEQVA